MTSHRLDPAWHFSSNIFRIHSGAEILSKTCRVVSNQVPNFSTSQGANPKLVNRTRSSYRKPNSKL